jgi:hypothetical protein
LTIESLHFKIPGGRDRRLFPNKITSQDMESASPARRKVIVSKDTLEQRGDVWIIPVHLFGLVDWNSVDKW